MGLGRSPAAQKRWEANQSILRGRFDKALEIAYKGTAADPNAYVEGGRFTPMTPEEIEAFYKKRGRKSQYRQTLRYLLVKKN